MSSNTRFRWLAVLALFTLAASPLAAQTRTASLAGDWSLTYTTPRGENTSTLHLTQQKDSLGGTAEMRQGSMPVTGTVHGDSVAFTVTMARDNRSFELKFTGRVKGDSASGTLATARGGDSPWKAARTKP